jgi:hypothetical protein
MPSVHDRGPQLPPHNQSAARRKCVGVRRGAGVKSRSVIDLARVLAAEFGLKVNVIEGNDADIDNSAQRFRVHADDPQTGPGWYAVKCSTGGSAAGLLVPAALAAGSVAGVPSPRLARDGRDLRQ